MRYGWALEETRWKPLWLSMSGLQWNSLSLLRTNGALIPESCGVYMICASPMRASEKVRVPPLYNAIYVGRSSNLRKRFGQHCTGYGEVRQAKRTFRELNFHYTVAADEDAKRLESLLIDALGPSANLVGGQIKARIGKAQEIGRKRIEG